MAIYPFWNIFLRKSSYFSLKGLVQQDSSQSVKKGKCPSSGEHERAQNISRWFEHFDFSCAQVEILAWCH